MLKNSARKRSAISLVVLRYGLAVLLVAIALAISVITHLHHSPPRFASHFVLLAIAITFWCAGTGPGLLALLLSCLGVAVLARTHFLTPEFPLGSFLVFFVVFSLLLSLFTASRRRALQELRKARDELEIKVAERTAELIRNERELRHVLDSIPALVWSALPDGSNSYVNRRYVESCGMPPEQLAGSGWHAATHPDDLERANAKWLAYVGSGKPFEDEVRFRRADGEYRWHLVRGVPLRDETGNIVKWYGVVTDIEDRKKIEEALRTSEAYLAEAQRLSQTGSWAANPVSDVTYWSEECYRVLGFDPQGPPPPFETVLHRIHPDDQAFCRERVEKGVRDKVDFEFDYRIVHPDNGVRTIHNVCHPVLDQSGNFVEFVGTLIDITERKRAEEDLRRAFEDINDLKDQLYRENLALKEEIDQASMFEEIVGSSDALRRVLIQIEKVAPADSTVLITGETGTGKELIARAIHKRSKRAGQTFISVNCASIPTSLIASELFGHEKGAFTGALHRRQGRFELAHGGTIFLDEVGDLPLETQIALLRVLQERQFERVGGNRVLETDVRVIAATNRDLVAAKEAGTFRADLFYRLNVFPIEVPALRQRADDIPVLVEYFVRRYGQKAGKRIKNIRKRTLELFQAYDWPGNVRELQNVVERAIVLSNDETFFVDESWLKPQSSQQLGGVPTDRNLTSLPLVKDLTEREKEMIEVALREAEGVVGGPAGAAAKLGIPRETLNSKIRKLGIKRYSFKRS